MTALDIQRALIRDRWHHGFALANYYPSGWWECDVFEITKAGYFREYEVKVSRSDFFADARKLRPVWPVPYGEEQRFENKHELLAAASTRGPSQFWFCTPPGLLAVEEVPAWAGLIEVHACASEFSSVPYWPREVKKAPKIHRDKFGERAAHARGICYFRMHEALKTREEVGLSYWPGAVEGGEGI